MAHENSLRLANERRRKDDRNRKIYELWKAGASYSEISKALGQLPEFGAISKQRIGRIVKRMLDEATADRHELQDQIFDGELDRLTAVIRQAWAIVQAPCRECAGQGVFQNGEVCLACRGEGKKHDPDTRIKGMKEVRAAIDQRSKMLGLYAPEKFAFTDAKGNDLAEHLRKEVSQMSTDDIDESLRDYMAGVEAAQAAAIKPE